MTFQQVKAYSSSLEEKEPFCPHLLLRPSWIPLPGLNNMRLVTLAQPLNRLVR